MSKNPYWKDQPLYHLYRSMLKRCYSPKAFSFDRYGGRGITVCERWRVGFPKGQGFRNFKADMGPRPDGYSLDRTNNDGNYEPSNCRWVPIADQHRNRSNNVWIEFMGVRMIAKDWARQTGVREDVITQRIAKGWPLEVALFDKTRLRNDDPTPRVEAAAAKRRAQTHCKRGHPLSGDNLYLRVKDGYQTRACKTCKREAVQRYRKAHS